MFQKDYWEKKRRRRTPGHDVIKAFVTPKINFIRKYIDIAKNARILDVGCGNGFFTYYFEKLAYTAGIDYSKFMLSKNPCQNLVQAKATELPFADETFDIVFCSNLLHHLQKEATALQEMKRVSKSYVALSEPNRNNPCSFIFHLARKEERKTLKFSLSYLKNLSQQNGLRLIASCSTGFIYPNKTPQFLLPLLKPFDISFPWGNSNIVILEK